MPCKLRITPNTNQKSRYKSPYKYWVPKVKYNSIFRILRLLPHAFRRKNFRGPLFCFTSVSFGGSIRTIGRGKLRLVVLESDKPPLIIGTTILSDCGLVCGRVGVEVAGASDDAAAMAAASEEAV
jgi:hypothetical protein